MSARRQNWRAASDRCVLTVELKSGPERGHTVAIHRANNFDALRMTAALLVIWSHQYALMGMPTPLIFGNEPGAIGVVLFFAISGYLVSQSWTADPSVPRFAMRRALRIWPALVVVVLLAIFVLGPLVTQLPLREYFTHAATRQHLQNLVLDIHPSLPGVFPASPHPGSVNGPLWTIPLEVGCYAVLALLGALGLMRRHWLPLAALLALAAALQWRYRAPPFPEWSFALQYGMIFTFGVVLARWSWVWQPRRWLAAAGLLVTGAFLYAWGPSPLNGQGPLLVLAGLAVVWGSACTPGVSRAGRFGDFSYGLYIYGFPVQQATLWWAGASLSFASALALSIAAALFFAVLSWHLVEKPALRWKPRRPAPGTSSASPAEGTP